MANDSEKDALYLTIIRIPGTPSLYGYSCGVKATFNNISVITWRSVLLVEETGEPGENHRPVASRRQTVT